MDNKKLRDELLEQEGINPAQVSDAERSYFKKMLETEEKRVRRLKWIMVACLWLFAIALFALQLAEPLLEGLNIPFVAVWAVLLIVTYICFIPQWIQLASAKRKLKQLQNDVKKIDLTVYRFETEVMPLFIKAFLKHRITRLAAAVLMIGFTLYSVHVARYEPNTQDTVILGQASLFSDSFAGLRVLVRNHATGRPIQNATVKLALRGDSIDEQLGEFTTGEDGSITDPVYIPPVPPGRYDLVVDTKSQIGKDHISEPVEIRRPYRLYITTDKPIYQPGQTIHMRAIVLNRVSLKPFSNQSISFEVEDPKGNKVFRTHFSTSDYGIGFADFDLANEVNLGRYRVRVIAGDVESEKIVTVKRYVLPKFKVEISTNRSYYLPSEKIKGVVKADYFFGKPVAHSQVKVVGRTVVEEPVEIFKVTGLTNENGEFDFSADLPHYFAGMPLAGGNAFLEIEATVKDTAGHEEKTSEQSVVAEEPINIHVIPESGDPVNGVENIIYILTAYPDGQPAVCEVNVNGSIITTDDTGIATFKTKPGTDGLILEIEAKDEAGNVGTSARRISYSFRPQDFLLRTDRAVYFGGETINVTVLSANSKGTFFLDVIKDGQTMLTKTLDAKDGRGKLEIDLSPEIFGTLKLNAYTITAEGHSRADWRIVHVHQADELQIETSLDKDVYRPGEMAKLHFKVLDKQGNPTPAALSLAAVDEAVFYLSENRPGLLEQFFLADRELLEPAYQIKFAVSPAKLLGGDDEYQMLAQAMFSSSVVAPDVRNLDHLEGQIEPERLEELRRNTQEGLYDELLRDAPYSAFSELLRPQDDYTLRATTYREKVARTEAFRDRYFEIVIASVMVILVVGIVLTIVIACFYSMLKVIRQNKIGDMDPDTASICQAVNSFVDSYGVLFLLPLATYIPVMIFCEIAGFYYGGRNFALWCVLGINAVMVTILSMKQFKWTQDLARFEQTRRLAARLGVLPAIFIIQYVVSRMIVIAAIFGLLDEGYSFIAVLTSFLMLGIIGAAAVIMVKNAAPQYRIKRKRSVLIEVSVAIALIALILGISMPIMRGRMDAARWAEGCAGLTSLGYFRDGAVSFYIGPRSEDTDLEKRRIVDEKLVEAGKSAPRIRKYFPETLLWHPELITDDRGEANLNVTTADSITTWRMNVDAVSSVGELGSREIDIQVFQDFFVDLDLPVELTRNDEVSIPILCYNYLEQPQTVGLNLKAASWCEIQGVSEQEVRLGPNEVMSVMFRIKAKDVGTHELTLIAQGEKTSDAIQRQIRVQPDGSQVEDLQSGVLTQSAGHTFYVPPEAIPNSESLILKLYPSTFSEVVEGLDSIFRMPFGCFEQTSSTTYPNVMALQYMKHTNQVTPEIEIKARKFITAGYQRLLTFEVKGGGFDWFGEPPANELLTAYGILEFSDMSKVHNVDPSIIDRASQWLISRQRSDGSWGPQQWKNVSDQTTATAYITWALTEAGQVGVKVDSALSYLRQHVNKQAQTYTIALAANAFLTRNRNDVFGRELLTHLNAKFQVQGDTAYISSDGMGAMYSRGLCLDVETTALSVLAMMKANRYPDTVKKALTWISQRKDQYGTWYSTQATILAMKALISGTGQALSSDRPSNIEVAVNGQPAGQVRITPGLGDLLHAVYLAEYLQPGKNSIQIRQDEDIEIPYRLVGTYWIPEKIPEIQPKKELEIQVDYDRVSLAVDDTLTCSVQVKTNLATPVNMAIIDLGIPPGFEVDTSAFQRLVESRRLAKYELTGNQCILYVRSLEPDRTLQFSYKLKALYPIRAKVPPAHIYEYYKPENEDYTLSQDILVENK